MKPTDFIAIVICNKVSVANSISTSTCWSNYVKVNAHWHWIGHLKRSPLPGKPGPFFIPHLMGPVKGSILSALSWQFLNIDTCQWRCLLKADRSLTGIRPPLLSYSLWLELGLQQQEPSPMYWLSTPCTTREHDISQWCMTQLRLFSHPTFLVPM